MHYSTRAITQLDKANYFRRHSDVIQYLEKGGKPTVKAISTALDYPEKQITDHHLELCAQILQNPLKFALPRPNSSHVIPFSSVAGPDNSQGSGVPGCYLLGDLNFMANEIKQGIKSPCYIGHSIRLGKRVKEHAKGLEPSTHTFLTGLGDNAAVFLFMVTKDTVSQLHGLPLKEFICVLEQYLFMHYFPSVNRSLVATAGVMHSPQAILKTREINGQQIYIYEGKKGDSNVPLIHRYTYISAGFCSTDLLNYDRLSVRGIIRRGG